MEIFGYDVRTYFLLFMIYSCLGWIMEVTCKLIQYKRFINRGFLIGPYCPIYGYGSILITLLLHRYTSDPIVLFFMAIIVCGTLEYLTSYFMEKLFHARWWDYSQRKFNINGRVCLNTIIPFGILGLLIMYVLNPFFLSGINKLSILWLNALSIGLFLVFLIDNIISGFVMGYIKKAERIAGKDLDNTEEITARVKAILIEKSPLHRRLVNAYPRMQAIRAKIKETVSEVAEKGSEVRQMAIEKSEELKQKAEEKGNEIRIKAEEKSEALRQMAEEKGNEIKIKAEEKNEDFKKVAMEKSEIVKKKAIEKNENLKKRAIEKSDEINKKISQKNNKQ